LIIIDRFYGEVTNRLVSSLSVEELLVEDTSFSDENQIKEAFINKGRRHSPSHLKFFLLVFSKLKEDIK